MRTNRTYLLASTVAGLTLCVALTAGVTRAQRPGGRGQGGPGQGGPGQGGPGQGPGGPGQGGQGQGGPGSNAQRQGGGRGNFGGQTPFAMGTITGGDAASGRITIQSQFGGAAQTLQLNAATQMVTQQTVSVADLQVNDQVQVQGVPTGITASSITAGQMPAFLQGGGGQGRQSGRNPGGANNTGNNGNNGAGNNGNNGNNGNAGGAGANGSAAFASATGRVTSLSPLTISLGSGVSLSIKPASDARITRIAPIAFNSLKVGDKIVAAGQSGADGTFTATGVGINMTMAGDGMGPGGGPGAGGFGPGGFGPGGFGPGGARPGGSGNQGQPGQAPPPDAPEDPNN